jgi:putative DNA primase/helicase
MRKVDLKALAIAEDITAKAEIVTPMPEPVVIPDTLQKSLGPEPDAMWIYRMADGAAFGAVARWNPPMKRKEIRPIVWDGKKFVTSGFGKDRPLYNGDMLAASPTCPVLIVEGEKAADGAAQYVPEGWVITTWQGGARAVDQTDWSLLAGHSCVVWPDNDTPGIEAALEIQKILGEQRVPVSIVTLSVVFPDGWDLADALPLKVKPQQITDILRRELKRAAVPEAAIALPEAAEDPDEEAAREWRPLGYDHDIYYFHLQNRQQVLPFHLDRLRTKAGCLAIYADKNHWAMLQGKTDVKSIDWDEAGSLVIRQCEDVGVYDPARMRGRGVWLDEREGSRVVLNSGNRLLVARPGCDTREVSHVRVKSRYIYTKGHDLILDVDKFDARATDDDGRMIRELCNKVRWEAQIHGDLLAGWIATAIVCGGLDWRTHAWVTGNQGSGKSTVVNMVAGACLGNMAIYPLGATTEAGIRQVVKNDAIPVVFDEAENGDKEAKMASAARRKAVMDLMRQSSSEGRGRILKGSANHQAQSFTMRSSFLMSSIGVGLKEAADLTRTAVLTIRPLDSFTSEERRKREEDFKDFIALALSIPKDMPQRLLGRQLENLFTLRHNIVVFKETIATVLANRRIGDQIGTLLAGCHSLYSTKLLDMKQCEKYLATVNLEDFLQVKAEREDRVLLNHIAQATVRVETMHGVQDRTLGELLMICFKMDEQSDVHLKVADDTLARYGLKVEREHAIPTGVWIGQSITSLNRIMQSSVYHEGWVGVLLRHPAAKKSENSVYFKGTMSRAIFMPKKEWPVGVWDR